MKFLSVAEIAKKWGMSDRSVRNYCAQGRIKGAFLTGKTWNIPADTVKPERENKAKFSDNELLNVLKEQKDMKLKGGIYHKTQITRIILRVASLQKIKQDLYLKLTQLALTTEQ